MRYLYLHGFASGPQSRKAQAFRTALAERGVGLEIPDLAAGDFEHLTIGGQLAVLEDLARGEPCRLVGSSMGGYLAALYASRHAEVERLVLLAPAFGFSARWRHLVGEGGLDEWRDTGWLEVYHYGDKTQRRVHWGLYEDAGRFPPFPDFAQPARMYHGVHDDVVPVELSRQFAAGHGAAQLIESDSDHELLSALDGIVGDAIPFLTA